jgi:hypothetical protein
MGVQLGCGAGFGAGAIDVALRGDHGLLAQELHQRVDADVGVGEFGGEGVAQTVHQRPGCPFAVDAGLLEGPQDPVLQRAAGDALPVGPTNRGAVGGKPVSASRLDARRRVRGKRVMRV